MKKIILVLLVISFFSCEKKYHWSPSESAPKHYPAKILQNYYQYKNGKGINIYGRTAGGSGWGLPGGVYSGRPKFKPVPDSLFVHWFSAAEGKFYKGAFKLPEKKIDSALNAGSVYIYTGFAPHGRVVVFTGYGFQTARFRAKEDTTLTPRKFLLNATNLKNEEEFEITYGRPLYTNQEIIMDYMSKEDSLYVRKHGIPDKW
ncbi:MAG: DUF2931 family protein [Flavobacteriaceae bacterium]|nr:DUF2931 family protein [Flavobacteriaceae bacterium]